MCDMHFVIVDPSTPASSDVLVDGHDHPLAKDINSECSGTIIKAHRYIVTAT